MVPQGEGAGEWALVVEGETGREEERVPFELRAGGREESAARDAEPELRANCILWVAR